MARTFSLDEAQTLLPVVQGLLQKAIAGRQEFALIAGEFQQVAARVMAAGGCELDVVALSARKAARDAAARQLKDALADIDALGVQVKDLDIGLLDFPCIVEGKIVLLCWKLGELTIGHWHGVDEGYAGRKRIDERIANAKGRKKVQ